MSTVNKIDHDVGKVMRHDGGGSWVHRAHDQSHLRSSPVATPLSTREHTLSPAQLGSIMTTMVSNRNNWRSRGIARRAKEQKHKP